LTRKEPGGRCDPMNSHYIFSLGAVVLLFLVAVLGVEAAGLQAVFGIWIPYIAFAWFIIGFCYRVFDWARSAVPFRIPTTAGQQKSLPWIQPAKWDTPFTKGGHDHPPVQGQQGKAAKESARDKPAGHSQTHRIRTQTSIIPAAVVTRIIPAAVVKRVLGVICRKTLAAIGLIISEVAASVLQMPHGRVPHRKRPIHLEEITDTVAVKVHVAADRPARILRRRMPGIARCFRALVTPGTPS